MRHQIPIVHGSGAYHDRMAEPAAAAAATEAAAPIDTTEADAAFAAEDNVDNSHEIYINGFVEG